MLISLIKCINGNETRYKYLPLEYCCDKMRLNPMLDLMDDVYDDSRIFCFECEEGRLNPFLPVVNSFPHREERDYIGQIYLCLDFRKIKEY